MPFSKVPKEIRDFVARYLPSVEHLETFVILQRNSTRSWSPLEIAEELRIPEEAAADVLERLASDNFLDVKISNDILYRYNPATPELQAAADRCSAFYVRERITITNLVMAASLSPMRDFAEAFRLRKDKKNG